LLLLSVTGDLPALPARQVIQTYARRMNIEQRLAEAIQSCSLDALAGVVPLNVDLDVILSVLAHPHRLPDYSTATPDTLQRRFLSTGGIIEHHHGQTTIRLAAAPTHRSCARAPRPTRSPSPGGAASPSTTSTTDQTGGQFA
jgi:hypothetical protein